MSSLQIRDQKTDHLLTPENSAVIVIDYQATQVGSIESTDKYRMVQIQRNWAIDETVPGMLGVLAGVGNGVGLSVGYNQRP